MSELDLWHHLWLIRVLSLLLRDKHLYLESLGWEGCSHGLMQPVRPGIDEPSTLEMRISYSEDNNAKGPRLKIVMFIAIHFMYHFRDSTFMEEWLAWSIPSKALLFLFAAGKVLIFFTFCITIHVHVDEDMVMWDPAWMLTCLVAASNCFEIDFLVSLPHLCWRSICFNLLDSFLVLTAICVQSLYFAGYMFSLNGWRFLWVCPIDSLFL